MAVNATKNPGMQGSRVLNGAIAVLLVLVITVFTRSWDSPSYVKWIYVAGLSAVCWGGLAGKAWRSTWRLDALDVLALALLAWVALSISWSSDSQTGADTAFHWLLLSGVFLYLRHSAQDTQQALAISVAAAVGTAVTLVFVAADIGEMGGYVNRNVFAEMLLAALPLLWPFTAALRKTPWAKGVIALQALIVLYLLFFNGSKIKFAVWAVLLGFFGFVYLARRSRRWAFALVALCTVAAVLLVVLGWNRFALGESHSFSASFMPRIELTIDTVAVWLTQPWVGVGAGGYNPVLQYHKDAHASVLHLTANTPDDVFIFMMAEQAHNDWLQFLANFGLVGLGLLGLGLYLARKQIAAWRLSVQRMAGLAVVLTLATNALIEFPLQMPATLTLFAIGLAWLLPAQGGFLAQRQAQVGAALLAALASLGWAWAYNQGQDDFGHMQAVYASDPPLALELNGKAIAAYPFEDTFRRGYLITLMDWEGRVGHSVVPESEYDRIFAVTQSAGANTGTLILRLYHLARAGRLQERAEEVQRWRSLLLAQSSRVPDVWLNEGILALAEGDMPRLRAALARYDVLTAGQTPNNRAAAIASLRSSLAPAEPSR